jgi:WXG100 family type VII secretion target
MGIGGYGTSPEEMERAGRHVLSVNESVQAELGALRAQLGPLAGLWQGLAAGEFAKLMQRWDQNARSLNDALRAIGESIEASGRSYEQQEDAQAASMSSITSSISTALG